MKKEFSLTPAEFLEKAKTNYKKYSSFNLPPTFIGFNMNLDYIVNIEAIDVIQALTEGIQRKIFPPTILQSFLEAFSRGSAREIVVEKNVSFDFIKSLFPGGKTRIGGQVGLMAEYVSKLFPKWEVHGFLLGTKDDWSDYGVSLPKINWVTDKNPLPDSVINTHLILEYKKGDELIDLNNNVISAPRENRFIIALEPGLGRKNDLPNAFKDYIESTPEIKSVIIAGIHLPWFRSSIGDFIPVFSKLKNRLLIHLEWTHVEDIYPELCDLLRIIDSLGFNEQEAMQILRCGKGVQASSFSSTYDLSFIVSEIFKLYGVPRLHGHTYGMYSIRDDLNTVKKIEEALLSSFVALLVCGTKTYSIDEISVDDLISYFSVIEQDNNALFSVPLYKNPLQTVGLGDSISVSGFAAYLAHNFSL